MPTSSNNSTHKYIHITDVHLNFLTHEQRLNYYHLLAANNPTHIFLTGDISDYKACDPRGDPIGTVDALCEMSAYITNAQIIFVLGNHDYYHSNVIAVRDNIAKLCDANPRLTYLTEWGTYALRKSETYLLGIDGWADGREGDYVNSRLAILDSVLIHDLRNAAFISKAKLLAVMQDLADKDTAVLHDQLDVLLWQYDVSPKNIIILTHVPPFKETCYYNGKMSDAHALPFFVNKSLGDMLLHVALSRSDINFWVLCGHTHSAITWQHLQAPNLQVICGGTTYGSPGFGVFNPEAACE